MPTLEQIEAFLNAWADLMWSTPAGGTFGGWRFVFHDLFAI